jgi:DNA polymerase III delta prime subunit
MSRLPVHTFISKYKPYTIYEFFEHNPKILSVVKTLHDLDDLNILFVGNSSSGKTTLLYSIIRDYYGYSQLDNISEVNIMFINNLKEQGINFYRTEMKTFCQSHCTIYGKKKMVVIDDLDGINEQSQQVFLNYIDKYKKNVNFISVCTNIQKVIEGIQSRMHIIKIPPTDIPQLRRIMEKILQREEITIDNESKEYLLKISNYSIRCLINNIEKIYILGDNVDFTLCKQICSNINFQLFDNYMEAIKKERLMDAIMVFYGIHDYGYSVIDILDYFFTFIKITDSVDEETKYRMIPFLCKYITIFHSLHEDIIELALFTTHIYNIVHRIPEKET